MFKPKIKTLVDEIISEDSEQIIVKAKTTSKRKSTSKQNND